MKKKTAEIVKEEFKNCVINTIKRIRKPSKAFHKPFHERLLSKDILKASLFERSFSTSFGQKVIEKISALIASGINDTLASRQKETIIPIDRNHIISINEHLNSLRENKLGRPANWNMDIGDIRRKKKSGTVEEHRIISDLWFSRNNMDHFVSIKTVGPNIDQTEKAKKDMLKLKISNKNFQVYFALPYNPYGKNKKDYNHSPAFKIFDMINDEVVLIGKEYWDLLGGNGTYNRILEIVSQVGIETKKLIEDYIHDKK